MVIIGIDPGTARTGFGVINKALNSKSKNQNKIKCLDYGVITTSPELTPGQRLNILYNELSRLAKKHKPDVLAVEKIFFFKNFKTVIPVSEAKGVILLAAAKNKIRVEQLTPLEVKMGICGYGRAEKKQIQRMVKELLDLKEIPAPDDAADALAIALCCAAKSFQGG